MVDEISIGMAVDKNFLSVGKSLVKNSPSEKVGIFCTKNGKPSVIEYIEVSDKMANETDGHGNLVYAESHINCNMFNIVAIEQIGAKKLPYYAAFKQSNFMDTKGDVVEATGPNSYKFESFIFDSFEEINSMLILRVKREEEFAPIKNATRKR